MNHVTLVLLGYVSLTVFFLKQSFRNGNLFLYWPLSGFSLKSPRGGRLSFSTFRIYFGPMKPSVPKQLLVHKLPQTSAKWKGYTMMSLSRSHLVINSCNKYFLSAYSGPGSRGLSQWARQDPSHYIELVLWHVCMWGSGGETEINKQIYLVC